MTVLLYEREWDIFLSAVFAAFERRDVSVRPVNTHNENLLFPTEPVTLDPVKSKRVDKGMRKLARDLPSHLYHAWLSERDGVEDDIIAVMRMGFDEKIDPMINLLHPAVDAVNRAARATGQERQRMLQFVRFVQTPDGVYVADIRPECDVLYLIADHFHGRFNDQRLLIRDVRRKTMLISNTEGWYIQKLGDETLPPLPEDGRFEALWRGYFEAIANPARKNLRLQQKFVPLRYREFLTEFQEIARKKNPWEH